MLIGIMVGAVILFILYKKGMIGTKVVSNGDTKSGAWGKRTRSGGTTKGNFYNCTCDGKNYYRVGYPCDSSAWLDGCNAQLSTK